MDSIGNQEKTVRIEEPRRGRPPKAEGKETATATTTEEGLTVAVIEEPVAPRRGRPPGVSKAKPAEVAQAAPLLVALTNQAAMAWLGPECGMLPQEQAFLTPSVARVLARMPRRAADTVSAFTDPLVILVALGMWFGRIAAIKEKQAREKVIDTPAQQARAAGYSGTSFEVPPDGPVVPFHDDNASVNGTTDSIFNTILPV